MSQGDDVVEDSGLPGCDTSSLVIGPRRFETTEVPEFCGLLGCYALYPRKCQVSSTSRRKPVFKLNYFILLGLNFRISYLNIQYCWTFGALKMRPTHLLETSGLPVDTAACFRRMESVATPLPSMNTRKLRDVVSQKTSIWKHFSCIFLNMQTIWECLKWSL
jgi:hypothetical protein